MSTAASLARKLGGHRQGNNWRCPCPLDCGYVLSMRDADDGKLLAHCFGGCDFSDILTALVEYGLFDDEDSPGPVRVNNSSTLRLRDDNQRIAHARQIYGLATSDERVGVYVRSRHITVPAPSTLRFSISCLHRRGFRLPAMVAPVVDIDERQIGVHMTYLRADGSGKAEFDDPDDQRECRGVIRGGTIRLAPHDPRNELLVAEGVETTLAAMQIFQLPGWAAIYADNLKHTLELPIAVRRIVIAADNDISSTGRRAAAGAHQRWTAEGRSVRILMPAAAGDDFNDILIKRGR